MKTPDDLRAAGCRFELGLFTPIPSAATMARIVAALSSLKLKLFLRNAENS